jgi:Flp pilus assembly protein protease CpaA
MTGYTLLSISVLLIVAAVYALFDVLNKRTVPNKFAFLTIVIGVAVALLNGSYELTFGLAFAIGLLSYVLYRVGMVGGGDVFEFVFVTLAMPVWQQPVYGGFQFFIPFIISVFIAAGYASLLFIPIYYLVIKKRTKIADGPNRESITLGLVMLVGYMIFLAGLYVLLGVKPLGVALVGVLAVASFVTILYQKRVYNGMVTFVYPRQLEEGDMIATNLMSKRDIQLFNSKTKFGRLATEKLIKDLRGVKKKMPVYKDSVPFSAFMFIGIVVSLLFGNLILLMVGV